MRGANADALPGAGIRSQGHWGASRILADAEGAFTLTVGAVASTVVATAEGHSPLAVEVQSHEDQVELRLEGTSTLKGRVFLSSNGKSVAGVAVLVSLCQHEVRHLPSEVLAGERYGRRTDERDSEEEVAVELAGA